MEIAKFIRNKDLPLQLVTVPGVKLIDILCSSRPYDRQSCNYTNCIICPLIINSDRFDCSTRNIVYRINCNICNEFYIGETYRPSHDRFSEHRRAANRPTHYPDEALAAHYLNYHSNVEPNLSFTVLEARLLSTVTRKIREAFHIFNLKPSINNREECEVLERFLLN